MLKKPGDWLVLFVILALAFVLIKKRAEENASAWRFYKSCVEDGFEQTYDSTYLAAKPLILVVDGKRKMSRASWILISAPFLPAIVLILLFRKKIRRVFKGFANRLKTMKLKKLVQVHFPEVEFKDLTTDEINLLTKQIHKKVNAEIQQDTVLKAKAIQNEDITASGEMVLKLQELLNAISKAKARQFHNV